MRLVFIVAATIVTGILFVDASALARSRSASAAQAGIPTKRESVVIMTGIVGQGEYDQFARAVTHGNPDLVVMNGPGGLLGEALLIAEEIHRRGLNTMVRGDAYCASACAVMFLAGRTKYLSPGAVLGLHAAGDIDGRTNPEATMLMAAYLRQVGVPVRILVKMAETSPRDMWWLDRSAQRALKIRGVGSPKPRRR